MPGSRKKVLGGLLLTALSIALFAAAWLMFAAGQPGAPEFADSRPDYGYNTSIKVALPKSGSIQSISISADFKHNPSNERQTLLSITVSGSTRDSFPTEPFYAIIELEDGSRMDNITDGSTGSPTLSVFELPGRQLLLVQLERSHDTVVSGVMRIAALSTNNSRTNFVSPRVGSINRCDFLPEGPVRTPPILPLEKWSEVLPPCGITNNVRNTVSVQVVDLYRIAPRVDYEKPKTLDEPESLKWKADNPDLGLKVRASYVDINRDAIAQRLSFLSGVTVGLACACVPYAVELVVGAFFRSR